MLVMPSVITHSPFSTHMQDQKVAGHVGLWCTPLQLNGNDPKHSLFADNHLF